LCSYESYFQSAIYSENRQELSNSSAKAEFGSTSYSYYLKVHSETNSRTLVAMDSSTISLGSYSLVQEMAVLAEDVV
jgi:hypothetical protein